MIIEMKFDFIYQMIINMADLLIQLSWYIQVRNWYDLPRSIIYNKNHY